MNQPKTTRDRLDRVFAIVRRTGRFIVPALSVVIIGSGVAVGYAMARQRIYKSETLILYREGAHPGDAPVAAVGEEPGERAQKLGVRVKEMVLSRTRLEQIITTYRLYGDIIFDRGMIDAVEELKKHIGFRVQDGDTFAVSFEGTNPERVRDVTGKLAEALIADNGRTTPEPQAEASKESFERDRDRLDKELKDKETALTAFLAKHPEFARENARQTAPIRVIRPPQPLKNDATLASLERETARLQERLDQPVAHARPQEVVADPALLATKQAAEAELQKAQKELTDKQGQFTEEHPDVRAAALRVRQAQEKVKRAGDAVAASLAAAQQRSVAREEDEGYIDRGALENQLRRINEEIADYKRRKAENAAAATTMVASSVVALEADWTRLNRELVEARAHVQSLREQERQAALVQAVAATGRTAQMAVIDPPYLPTHEAGLSHVQVMVAGIVASFVLALLLAFALALLDERIYDRFDVERVGLPLLSVVPRPGKGGSSRDELVNVG
ncbi:MAG: hypothetical protein ACXVAN_04100 [Polyangia bacterium]